MNELKFPLVNRARFKIPEDSEVVYDNDGIFKMYRYPQAQFNGTTKIYEHTELLDASFTFAIRDGKILFSEQMQAGNPRPFYSMLGGFVERGEDPLAAAKRELAEEGAVESDDWFKLFEYNKSDKMAHTEHVYIARGCRNIGEQKLDSSEKIKLLELTPKEFVNEMLYHPDFREGWLLQFFSPRFTPAMLIEMLEN